MMRALLLRSLVSAFAVILASLCEHAQAEVRQRPYVEIAGPVVKLSDLFSGLGAGQDMPLGEAPAPGARLVIGGAQLAAIAQQFGVDWDPPRVGATTTLLRRGHAIDLDAVLSKLRPALLAAGVASEAVVTVEHFPAPMVDDGSTLSLDPPELDGARDRFRTMLRATCGKDVVLAIPLEGSIQPSTLVAVPLRPIRPGETIAAEDLGTATIARNKLPNDPVLRPENAIGEQSRVLLLAGLPIAASTLHRADLVRRGAPVMIHLAADGIDIVAQGTALQGGSLDDRVPVLNPSSHVVLYAWVMGDSTVRVDPESRPAPLAPGVSAFGVAPP